MHLRTEKDRSKYGGVRNMEVQIMGSHLEKIVKIFSPYQINSSNKKDVPVM